MKKSVSKRYTLFIIATFVILFCLINSSDVSAADIGWCENITSSGTYTLNTSVESTGTCFNVTVSDVIIDCNLNTIDYSTSSGGYGVYSNSTNTTIKNCNINQANSGTSGDAIYFNTLNNGYVYNNNITLLGSSYGIYLKSSNYSNFSNNNFNITGGSIMNFYGVLADFSSYNIISYNNISMIGRKPFGVLLEKNSNNNAVFGNNIASLGTEGGYGVELWAVSGYQMMRNNSVFSNVVYSLDTGIGLDGADVGIGLDGCSIYYNNITAVGDGVFMENYCSNSSIYNNSITIIGEDYGYIYGVYIDFSGGNLSVLNNNITVTGDMNTGICLEYNQLEHNPSGMISNVSGNIINVTGAGDSFGWGGYGIHFHDTVLFHVFNNNITTSEIDSYGVFFAGEFDAPSTNNSFLGNNLNAQNSKDIVLGDYSYDNTFINETIGAGGLFPTTISYLYSGNFQISHVDIPPSDPENYTNVSKYVNVTNLTGGNWLFINITYFAGDIPIDWNESSMALLHYNASGWSNTTDSGVNTTEKLVYGNATSFSVLAPLVLPFGEEDTTAPVASFGTNPVESYNSTTSSITFDLKCSDDIAVDTIQLWTNATGVWQVNQTNSSPYNDTWWNVTVTGISDGSNYRWAVYCNDTNSLTNMTNNRTFSVDTTPPAITLISPENNYEFSSGTTEVSFSWNVTDNFNSNISCNLYTQESYQEMIYCGNTTTCNQIISGFSAGSYNWRVNCSDGTNENVSDSRNFTIVRKGGGGGGGDITNVTNVINATNQTPGNENPNSGNPSEDGGAGETSTCGDGVCAEGEDQTNCCIDCGGCSSEPKFNYWILTGILPILIVIILIIFWKKKKTLEQVVKEVDELTAMKKRHMTQNYIKNYIKTEEKKNKKIFSEALKEIDSFNDALKEESGWGIKLAKARKKKLRDKKKINKKEIPILKIDTFNKLDEKRLFVLEKMMSQFGRYKKLIDNERMYLNKGSKGERNVEWVMDKLKPINEIFSDEEGEITRLLEAGLVDLHKCEDAMLSIIQEAKKQPAHRTMYVQKVKITKQGK